MPYWDFPLSAPRPTKVTSPLALLYLPTRNDTYTRERPIILAIQRPKHRDKEFVNTITFSVSVPSTHFNEINMTTYRQYRHMLRSDLDHLPSAVAGLAFHNHLGHGASTFSRRLGVCLWCRHTPWSNERGRSWRRKKKRHYRFYQCRHYQFPSDLLSRD